jgi:quercetin dioxygenase-like cupin family protein
MNKAFAVAISLGIVGVFGAALAQQSGFKRTLLQTQDLSTPETVVVQAIAEFGTGIAAGRHTHPGEEMGYVMEGQIELKVDGKPPQIIQAGQTFFVPRGIVHDGVNTHNGTLKVLATYVVDKGKPVASPAP